MPALLLLRLLELIGLALVGVFLWAAWPPLLALAAGLALLALGQVRR